MEETTKFKLCYFFNLVTPKAGAKLELLFNKLASGTIVVEKNKVLVENKVAPSENLILKK